MQVSDVTKNGYYINNTYNSMGPLIWLLGIFALNCNIEPIRSKSYVLIKSFCTSSILGCMQFYCLYFKISNVYFKMDISIKITDMVQIISDFCQYNVDLYFVYKYGSHICMEYFKQYEKIDKFLDASCYSVMKRKLLKIILFFTTIWITSSFCDLGAWVVTYGWLIPISHSVTYIFLFIKMLTALDMIAHVTHIEARMRMIGNLVQNCYSCTDVCPVGLLTEDCIRNKNWLYSENSSIPHSPKPRSNDSVEIKRLTKCYLLLFEQVMFINKMYGYRILLNTMSLLLDMVKIMNLAIRIAIGSQRTLYNNGDYNYLPGLTGVMRLLTCAAIIISLVDQCEQVYQQRERTIHVIDHLLVNKNPDGSMRSAVMDLRALLQERPICFNMANFFTLNYSFLVSISSVVVTYTIILLQSVK